ncbi:MAG: ShlB/FhaC/HecB family hemolysin secretion/activation protein [Porticoccus sp.]|nr:ShlB/FhaC/HecB family hemolysin secretion/activation protein [Porticoccus sp.]
MKHSFRQGGGDLASSSYSNYRLLPLSITSAVNGFTRTYLRSFIVTILWLCLFVGFFQPVVSFAATPADINAAEQQAEIIQRQEQERIEREREEARRRSERVDGMDTKALVPKIEVPDIGATCRDIKKITITSAPNLSDAIRKQILSEFTGRCLNVGDIERILAVITKDYIDRGYITTRAYLPPQDLTKGHLEILVIEGVLNKIKIEDGDAESISIRNVFPGLEGNPLNLRDLEQGIDQINRLASNSARLDIQPGEKEGTSDVVVHNQPQSPYHYSISVDNQASESTGKTQTGLTASADNPLGYNDMFSITHRQSTPRDKKRKDSISDNLNFSIPFGYNTLHASASHSKYYSPLTVPSGLELVSSGNSKTYNMRFDRVMYRDQSSRGSLSATLTSKESKNYLAGEFLAVSSRKLTVLDIDGKFNTGLAGGVLTLDLGYARGLKILGGLEDISGLPGSAPRAQFSKYKLGLNYARPFQVLSKTVSFTSQFTGQKANDTLFGSEQISIGGIYSVRGFVKNTRAGDNGYYWRNELSVRQPLALYNQTISTRYYIGYDIGKVSSRVSNSQEGSLTGMVVGLSGNWRGVACDVFYTKPLTLPSSMDKESNQTWFRVTYSI